MVEIGQPTPNIQLNETSKRAYDQSNPLSDYATRQGAPVEAFVAAGVHVVTYRGRPALKFPDGNGSYRIRYTDGQEPRWDSPRGYQMTWYGLDQALALSPDKLILVNGIPSVIAAQWHGIPAFCVSGGESAAPKPHMLKALQAVAAGREITVAYDCDTTGQQQAAKRARHLIDAGFIVRAVDLQLGKNGDFADFVKLHDAQALNMLGDLPEITPDEPKQTRITYISQGDDHRDEYVQTVVIPAIERRAGEMKGKHFHCINPLHPGGDQHQSARVGPASNGARYLYYCSCGAHGLLTVAKWLNLPTYREWLKANYPTPKPPTKRPQSAQKARINGVQSAKIGLPSLLPFTADLTVDLPDMRQLEPGTIAGKRTLVIKSPTGMYKTAFNGQVINALAESATVLVLTHRVALVKDISKRFDIPDYKNFKEGYERSAPRLVSTIDSLHKQAGRKFTLVVIDESTQGFAHLINAGTLKGKAAQTLEIAEQIIRDADTVICADANNNDTFVGWLKGIRPDVFTIENTHRPTRANTSFLPSYSGAIQTAINEVGKGEGPVLIPCAAQGTARKIHKLLARLYPDKRGRIISARNSQTDDVQEFLSVINDELPALDWLAYTSSMGTGVNIYCPVAAVVGIAGQPVAPADFMQMLGRARNAKTRFVYAPECSGGGETNAEKLFDSRQRAARYSASYGTSQPDSGVQKLARREAINTAQQNREMATYRDHLAAYLQADGSAPGEAYQQPARATLDALKLITEEMAQTQKTNALTLQPVTNDELDKKRDSGAELTDAILDANLRYKIERASGLTISESLYDRLHTAENRRRMARFASLIDDEQALVEFDRQQASERTPLHQRHNSTASRRVFLQILKRAFGINTLAELKTAMVGISKDELAERVAFIGVDYRDQLTALFGWRADGHDASLENPVGLFRWLCARYFIKFESKRIRQGDKLTYAYTLNTTEFDALLTIARARIEARLAEKNEMFQKRESNTMPLCVFGTTPEQGEKHISGTPTLEPIKTWIPPTNSRGASRSNPFSKAVA